MKKNRPWKEQMVSALDAKMLSLNEEIQAIEKEQEQKSL